MRQPDDIARLRHMADHAREALALARDKSREDLDRERMLQLSLVRLVEIVGEAASRISKEYQEAHPSIPWRGIVGMRNRLIHGYEAIDLDVLWATIQDDLPPLIAELERLSL